VEYRLTSLGERLRPVVAALLAWGAELEAEADFARAAPIATNRD
jgi:DNA-binding HxlR family transcriptional regulator